MRPFSYFLLLSSLFLSVSCTEEVDNLSSDEAMAFPKESDGDAINALQIASMFFGNGTRSFNSTSDFIVTELTSKNGEVMAFCANKADGKGFVIVSNSKDLPPVLAYSHENNFEIKNENIGVANWIESLEEYFNLVTNGGVALTPEKVFDIQDEIRHNRMEWNKYQSKPVKSAKSVVYNTENWDPFVQDLFRQAVILWESRGWTYYPASEASPNQLPLDVYMEIEDLKRQSENDMSPGYKLIDYAYVVEWNDDELYSRSNFLTTQWDQDYPYNIAVMEAYPSPGYHYLGCTAVALGQIIRKREDLPGYDYSIMPDKLDYRNFNESEAHEVSRLLFDLGTRIGIDYASDNNGATLAQTEDAIKSLGYKYERKHIDLKGMVKLDYPLMVFGYGNGQNPNNQHANHAWVVDGSNTYYSNKYYMVMVPNYYPDDVGTEPYIPYNRSTAPYCDTRASYSVHCNWGLGGRSDGYYYYFRMSGNEYPDTYVISLN